MVSKGEGSYPSRGEKNDRIHYSAWGPSLAEGEKPLCILQIIHGMAEYIDRYDEFAQFMAGKGILVVGEDHLGHGKTYALNAPSKPTGYFCSQDPATVVVRDAHRLKKMVQQHYPGVPYFILGHSMGSFILRNYLFRYGTGIDGAIVAGTGMQPGGLILLSRGLAAVQGFFCGKKHVSNFLNACAFGSYTKRIDHPRTRMDWLSRDPAVVDRYLADPLCGFTFTVNGFQTLFELLHRLRQKENLEKVPKDLPVLFLSGKEDPVGGYGKGVEAAFRSLEEQGLRNLELRLYEQDRHEILNEPDRKQIYEEIYQWLTRHLPEA